MAGIDQKALAQHLGGLATVTPTQLTFSNTDWNQPQTVVFSAVDDLAVDGTNARTITLASHSIPRDSDPSKHAKNPR